MRQMFSRYGGHMFILGEGKASSRLLPEKQSLENMLTVHATQLKGFSYLSSYQMLPSFMHPFEKLPNDALKIGDLTHLFMEVGLQYDIEVETSIYVGRTGYINVFPLYIKTDLKPLTSILGKMESYYDCPIIIRIQGKSAEELNQSKKEIYYRMISLLVYEMELFDSDISFLPSRTAAGKLIDTSEIETLLKQVKAASSKEDLANLLAF